MLLLISENYTQCHFQLSRLIISTLSKVVHNNNIVQIKTEFIGQNTVCLLKCATAACCSTQI